MLPRLAGRFRLLRHSDGGNRRELDSQGARGGAAGHHLPRLDKVRSAEQRRDGGVLGEGEGDVREVPGESACCDECEEGDGGEGALQGSCEVLRDHLCAE